MRFNRSFQGSTGGTKQFNCLIFCVYCFSYKLISVMNDPLGPDCPAAILELYKEKKGSFLVYRSLFLDFVGPLKLTWKHAKTKTQHVFAFNWWSKIALSWPPSLKSTYNAGRTGSVPASWWIFRNLQVWRDVENTFFYLIMRWRNVLVPP